MTFHGRGVNIFCKHALHPKCVHMYTVDGGYGAWSDYGECSVTCGGGQQSRERKCNNPEPLFGGKTCEQQELGPGSETKICNDEACPGKFPSLLLKGHPW